MTETSPNAPAGAPFIPDASPTHTPASTNPAQPPAPRTPAVGKAELPPPPSVHGDQLARIEDKTARIEDKYARSEALLSRVEEKVEAAAARMNEAARQSDLASLRGELRGMSDRVRRMPGTGALVLTAIITSVLTVVLMVAVQRLNLDHLLPPRAGAPAGQTTAPANPQ